MITWLAEQAHADTWMDIWARLVDMAPGILTAAGGAIVAIVIARRGAARHAESADALREVREQVTNTHATNLRDDIDQIGDSIRRLSTTVRRLDDRTARIGQEVRDNQQMRRDADAEIRSDVAALRERVESSLAKHHPDS